MHLCKARRWTLEFLSPSNLGLEWLSVGHRTTMWKCSRSGKSHLGLVLKLAWKIKTPSPATRQKHPTAAHQEGFPSKLVVQGTGSSSDSEISLQRWVRLLAFKRQVSEETNLGDPGGEGETQHPKRGKGYIFSQMLKAFPSGPQSPLVTSGFFGFVYSV